VLHIGTEKRDLRNQGIPEELIIRPKLPTAPGDIQEKKPAAA